MPTKKTTTTTKQTKSQSGKTTASKPKGAASKPKAATSTVTAVPAAPTETGVTLMPLHIIDWRDLGLRHHDLVGWEFSQIVSLNPQEPTEPYQQIGLVIHAPFDLDIHDGMIHWNPEQAVQTDHYEILKNWTSTLEVQHNRVILHLPVETVPGGGALVIPPPEIGQSKTHLDVLTTSHQDGHPNVIISMNLPPEGLLLKRGMPIAHLVPIRNNARPQQPMPQQQPNVHPDAHPQGQPQMKHFQPLQPGQRPLIQPARPENMASLSNIAQSIAQPQQPQIQPQQPQGPQSPIIQPHGQGLDPKHLDPPSKETLLPIEPYAPEPFQMRVWRVHPEGVKVTRATKDLRGDAPYGAMKFCGPFTHANAYGYWLFPSVDLDIIWHGGRSFDYKIIKNYTDADQAHVLPMERPDDPYHYSKNVRMRIDFGGVAENIVSIWTGCIFQTPPGWGLMIRNPVNVKGETIFRIQEGILETDWLSYDIWMNLEFIQQEKWVHIRSDKQWPPIAQLVPVPRAAYDDQWGFEERMIERNTPEGQSMYDRWIQYNYRKWLATNQKDSTTYHRTRAKSVDMLKDNTPEMF